MSQKLRFFDNISAHLPREPQIGAAGPGIFEFVRVKQRELHHKQPKVAVKHNSLISHNTVLLVSVRTNHHHILLITTV